MQEIESNNVSVQEQENTTQTTKQTRTYNQTDVDNLINIQKEKYDKLEQEFKLLKNQVESQQRQDILNKFSFDNKFNKHIEKLVSDIKTQDLQKYLEDNEQDFNVFKKSKVSIVEKKQENTQPTNETPKTGPVNLVAEFYSKKKGK